MKVPAGYTLIELMAVIAIVSILLAIGVPSYRYVTNSNRVSAEVNTLLGDLQFARAEAIKEGATVTVCPVANPAPTPVVCGNSSQWNTGWAVLSATAATPLLHIQQPFATTSDSFVSKDGQTAISFDRNGFAHATPALTNAGVTIKLTPSPANTQWIRCVEIQLGGMLTTARYNQDANCK